MIDVGLLQLAVDKLRSKSLERTQMEAIEKASGEYGRFGEAVKKIDPRKE